MVLILVAWTVPWAHAQEATSLFDLDDAGRYGWTPFDGAEFPGAKVRLEVDETVKHNGKPTLRLTGDFSGGGNYVAMNRDIDADIKTFSTWLKYGGSDHVTVRFVDSSGQCHQINIKIANTDDWQRVTLSLADFFAKRGMTDAVTNVSRYESWGGKNDSKWHPPAKHISVLVGPGADRSKPRSLWLGDPQILSEAPVSASVTTTLPLEEVIDGEPGWGFSNGQEFPGAKGDLGVEKDQPEPGKWALRLNGDFTGGGAYVETSKDLKPLGLTDLTAVRAKIKSNNVEAISVRLIDGTGQVHQKGGVKIVADGKFHEVVIKTADVVGGEHWGGANDGKWHGSPQLVTFIIGNRSDTTGNKKPSIVIADAVAEGTVPAKAGASAFAENFEKDQLAGWETAGSVGLDDKEPFKGKKSLVLSKSESNLQERVAAISPAFPVTPGAWEVKVATRTDMQSMDNSYNGTVVFETLNAGGAVVSSTTLAEPWRKSAWKPVARQVNVPEGATQARFRTQINKETPGKLWVDELSATPIVVAQKDDRIKRMMFTTVALGNLLLPTDSRVVTMTVLASKPLPPEQQTATVTVKDYWGAEQGPSLTVTLKRQGKQKDLFVYEGTFDLSAVPMEIGKYYEMHGAIERKDQEPFKNYSALAILPEAPANSFKPEEIPWTSRNWDNRIPEYVMLTHRLGIRICGVWGGWEPQPPYKPHAPQLELIEKLGMGWLTGSPAHTVEQRGKDWEKWTEKALREGARNFVKTYGHVRPMIVNLGNEPHNRGDAVKPDVNAYRILYDEFKKIDPSIIVVGTSVGTGIEDYFAHGFGQWCDAYDFHIYEDSLSVRRTLEQNYPAMFKKYGHAKPIWSTELGLNSQGLARQTVAGELFKKTANFFAGGGASMSWFGLLYPDSEGTAADSFGAAHNVFDCRYNKYNPKLDAIAYYNAVNSILNKKFVTDRVYDGATRVYLFRDQQENNLLICYRDKGRVDAFIPLPGVTGEVSVIRIDGTRGTLNPGGKGVGVTISEDPILLMYQGGPASLPEQLGESPLRLAENAPTSIVRSEPAPFEVRLADGFSADRVALRAPPMWKATKEAVADGVRFSLQPPEETTIREADMLVTLNDESGRPMSELIYRPAVTGTLSVQLLPEPGTGDTPALVKVVIRNNSPQKQDVSWDVVLLGEQSLDKGVYGDVGPTDAYFAESPSGMVSVEGKSTKEVILPIAGVDLMKVYRAKASIRDASGRIVTDERPLAGFVAVPKATTPVTLDGSLDDAAWQRAQPRRIDRAEQFFVFQKKENEATWQGPQDLSADLRFLWDDEHLYVGVTVTDDIAGPVKPEYQVWQQDGLQFLIDPMRTSLQKVGKYDYGVGDRPEGAKAQCFLAADGSIQLGDQPEIIVKTQREKAGSGNITYEIAIPWKMIAPFKPAVGANLGLTMIVNEDDGFGRDSFLTWFGNAHNKDVDKVGDLILKE